MSEQNPWRTVDSRVVYQNPWIKVREDQVIRPDGKNGIYGVVETKVAVGVVALTPQLEVYLVGQYRYATNCYSWELIEGGAEHGEDPLAAIKRELKEEAGLIASDWQLLGDEIQLSNCISSEIAKLYLATGLTSTSNEPEGTEVLTVKKLPFSDCLTMAYDGRIKDSMTLIGLSRVDMLIRGGKLVL